jgi:hypothetical protein
MGTRQSRNRKILQEEQEILKSKKVQFINYGAVISDSDEADSEWTESCISPRDNNDDN